MIIAVDFDDTLFEYVPPSDGSMDYSGRPDSIGAPIWKWINWAKEQKAQGHKLILWTCREGEALVHAVRACRAIDLEFDAVNESIRTAEEWKYWPDCRKVKADLYLDDKGLRAEVGHKVAKNRDAAWKIQEIHEGKPHGWIQWKGTTVCMDVHCKCGELAHIDEDFAYHVKCGKCGTVYMVNGHVEFVELEEEPDHCVVVAGSDEID